MDGGKGQSRLERVLFAYSVANPVVGYTQGMNYIVALLLGFMPEEEVFGVGTKSSRDNSVQVLVVWGFQYVVSATRRSGCCGH